MEKVFQKCAFQEIVLDPVGNLCHEHISLELLCSEANRSSPLHFNTCGALFFSYIEWSVELIEVLQPNHSTKKDLEKILFE